MPQTEWTKEPWPHWVNNFSCKLLLPAIRYAAMDHVHWHSVKSRFPGKYFMLEPNDCDSKQAKRARWSGQVKTTPRHLAPATIHQAARQQMSSGGRPSLTLTYRLPRRHGLPIASSPAHQLQSSSSSSRPTPAQNSNWVMTATMAKNESPDGAIKTSWKLIKYLTAGSHSKKY